jgi:polyisoprenoid-binding protein YceI
VKKSFLAFSLLAALAVLMSFNNPLKEETYTVDTDKSTITWSAKKVGGGHTGTINIASGSLVADGKSLLKGSFLINMASITSDNERVTGQLKADVFFDAQKNPTSKFEITKVEKAGTDRVNITGNLTIKGITHPLTFPATVKQQKDIIVAVATGVRIDRTKYDMKFRSKTFFLDIGDRAVDDEFEININLIAKK